MRHRITAGGALLLSSCTYAAPEPLVHVEHHVLRAGTESLVVAVSAAQMRRPTGLAAFPDGGSPRLDDQQGIFYLCVGSSTGPSSVRRGAVSTCACRGHATVGPRLA